MKKKRKKPNENLEKKTKQKFLTKKVLSKNNKIEVIIKNEQKRLMNAIEMQKGAFTAQATSDLFLLAQRIIEKIEITDKPIPAYWILVKLDEIISAFFYVYFPSSVNWYDNINSKFCATEILIYLQFIPSNKKS